MAKVTWVDLAATDIAAILNTSRRTVEKHVERLMKKLGTENRLSAMRMALDTLAEK